MISTRLKNRSIKIRCSKSEIIDCEKLKYIYRTGMKFMSQNQISSVIIEVEEDVRFSNLARKMFNRLEERDNQIPRVIIAG